MRTGRRAANPQAADPYLERLDRIERKLDEVLSFRDWLQGRVSGLLGEDGAPGGAAGLAGLAGTVMQGIFRNGSKSNAGV